MLFNFSKIKVLKNKKLVFNAYFFGDTNIAKDIFLESFADFEIKEVYKKSISLVSFIKLRKIFANEYCLLFCEKNIFIKFLLNFKFFKIPIFVDHLLDLSRSKQEIEKSFARSIRYKIKKIKSFNYSYKIETKNQDLKNIYQKMYLKMMLFRHKAKPESFKNFKKYFKDGCLTVYLNDLAVGYASLSISNASLIMRRTGILDANEKLYEKNVSIAIYYFLIKHAIDSGMNFLDLGYSVPFLNNGVLIYKNRWGAKLFYDKQAPLIYLKVGKINKQMKEYFFGKPIIYLYKNKLGALVFGGEGDKFHIKKNNEIVDITYFRGIDFLKRLR